MARRNESLLNLLAVCPWWVSVVISACAFVGLRYVLPSIEFQNPFLKSFATVITQFAAIIAIVPLIPAPISAYNSWRKRKLVDSQKDLDSIRALGWKEFEELVSEAYRRQGYSVVENAGAGPDEGIDLVLKKNGTMVLVQCKQWRSTKVGVNIIREVYGVMTAKKADSAIVITSGLFTQEAKNFAADKPIDLVDGGQLIQLIVSLQKGRVVPATAASSSLCPKCGGEMVLRTAQRGSHPGEKFWGCSNFPRCRFTKLFSK
jgi:restriction system protein